MRFLRNPTPSRASFGEGATLQLFGAEMAAELWDRFTVHYTPTHGSWLNQAEIEIGIFAMSGEATNSQPYDSQP
jgi:hypothetical protein